MQKQPIHYKCADCGNSFDMPIEAADMLFDILDNNPALKLICSKCGYKIERNFALSQYIKRMKAHYKQEILQPGR